MRPEPDSASLPTLDNPAVRRRWLIGCGLVFLAAVIMGAPALLGGFLSGDDIQLVRDHVLVNHPSFEHAAKLFTIIHRDLYQPVALLSLSLEFALIRALGLQPDASGMPPAAWLFHLTNVILHALNALLVCVLLRRVTGKTSVALLAGAIFALHPINVETVAWLNGRMMLLSTLFLLVGIIHADRVQTGGRWANIVWAVVFIALCMMSKVRVAAPALMALPLLFRWQRPTLRWWVTWSMTVLVTGVFVLINYQASSTMIMEGTEYLQGSRIARTLQALAWYWSHLVVPVGLAPFHPAEKIVHWSDPGIIRSAVIVSGVLAAIAVSIRRTRTGWVAMLWFLAAIAVTLPLIPARNLLVAERYAYLPNIGLYWLIAAALVRLFEHLLRATSPGAARLTAGLVCAVGAIGMLAVSWKTTTYYRNDVNKTGRVAAVYSDHAGLIVRNGWAMYHAGDTQGALAAARADLERHGDEVACEACQLIGLAQLRLGHTDEALAALRGAIAADPESGIAQYQLGKALLELGRPADSIAPLEECAQLMPLFNPGLTRLAEAYRAVGRSDDARRTYELIIKNNPYDVFAATGLAEMDIADGRFEAALDRLHSLLEWMPENVPARINAGVCLVQLGKKDEAMHEYKRAIKLAPYAKVAVLNLALLQIGDGDRTAALDTLTHYLGLYPADRDALAIASQTLIDAGELRRAAELWSKAITAEPDAADLLTGYARVSILAGQWDTAAPFVERAVALNPSLAEAQTLLAALHIRADRHEQGLEIVEQLRTAGVFADQPFTDGFLGVFDRLAADLPADPWPHCAIAVAASAAGRTERAASAIEAARQRGVSPDWTSRVGALPPGNGSSTADKSDE